MLVGPGQRPTLPLVPGDASGLPEILRYLKDLDQTLSIYLSTLVGGTVGMLGVQGLSAGGTGARNFTKGSLAIGGATSSVWSLLLEVDASYLVLYAPSRSTGMVLTSFTRATTNVTFTFNPDVPSGMLLDCVLLR